MEQTLVYERVLSFSPMLTFRSHSQSPNVPKKQDKFKNFLKNTFKVTDENVGT